MSFNSNFCFLFSILKVLLRIDGFNLSNLTRCHCTHCTLLLLGPFSTNIIRIWLMLFQVRLLQMTFTSLLLIVSKVFLWIDRLQLSNLSEYHCTLGTHPDEAPLLQISSENGWCCCKWGICWCHFICIVVVDCQFIKYFLGLMDYTCQMCHHANPRSNGADFSLFDFKFSTSCPHFIHPLAFF